MDLKDIEYLVDNCSDLCGIPVRIYNYGKKIYFHSLLEFPKDPAELEYDNILSIDSNVGYITTKDFFYYGILNHKSYTIAYGPFRLIAPDDSIISRMALELELGKDEIPTFNQSIRLITSMSLETLLQSLCMLNFVFNKERKTVSDILIDTSITEKIEYDFKSNLSNNAIEEIIPDYTNNSYTIETELYKLIEHGKINELKTWLSKIPPIKPGVLSKDSLRQAKNMFIAAITLVSRSAIKGHMEPNEALSLSDLYIQRAEIMQSITEISSLQMNMVLDYTERVAKIHGGGQSPFLIDLNKYIIAHMSEAIKTDDICDSLYISKSALFTKLKKETGMTVSNYILTMKIDEAKSLIKFTKKSMAAISLYLGFSSQSHFNHTFKSITGMSPIEYKRSLD